jgi:hypothetical protein
VEIGGRRRHSPEIVSLLDRPTADVFLCPYVLPVYLLPFPSFLKVLWFWRFRPAVVSDARGRGKPEVTSPFD